MDPTPLNESAVLVKQARRPIARGDPDRALHLLLRAEVFGVSIELLIDKALALSMQGETSAAVKAIGETLVLGGRVLITGTIRPRMAREASL